MSIIYYIDFPELQHGNNLSVHLQVLRKYYTYNADYKWYLYGYQIHVDAFLYFQSDSEKIPHIIYAFLILFQFPLI